MNMMAYGYWLRILYSTRMKIADLFQIPKSKYVHVVDNEIVEDGFTESDLKNLTIEKMQNYLGTQETDFYALIDAVIARLENREILASVGIEETLVPAQPEEVITPSESIVAAPEAMPVLETTEAMAIQITPKKRGRPAKAKIL